MICLIVLSYCSHFWKQFNSQASPFIRHERKHHSYSDFCIKISFWTMIDYCSFFFFSQHFSHSSLSTHCLTCTPRQDFLLQLSLGIPFPSCSFFAWSASCNSDGSWISSQLADQYRRGRPPCLQRVELITEQNTSIDSYNYQN